MANNKSLDQWLELLETRHDKKIDLGLTRVKQVYENLKLDKIAPIIITVAGTNGKGSTVAMLSSICRAAGYGVGEFSSPHLIDYNERIKVNNKNASDDEIIEAFKQIEQNLKGITLSYFEYTTLAALIVFKQRKVDVAVLEVGLGGRLDSVNVVDSDCAIITTIDIDHTAWLGDDIESIAFEKAGIMRQNKPVVYGDIDCPLAIKNQAKKINAQLILAREQAQVYQLELDGDYQQYNANTAVVAIKALQLNINQDQIAHGLKKVSLQARLQQISSDPAVILDVAHNKQAAISLSSWLQNNPIEGKTLAVFSVLADKNVKDWLAVFSDVIDIWCISQANSSRAMTNKELLAIVADYARLVTSFSSIKLAFEAAKTMAQANDRIIVFGSFYTVSDVIQLCD
jgi:dihydrofolate synthase/folylpolyglutamate synthase